MRKNILLKTKRTIPKVDSSTVEATATSTLDEDLWKKGRRLSGDGRSRSRSGRARIELALGVFGKTHGAVKETVPGASEAAAGAAAGASGGLFGLAEGGDVGGVDGEAALCAEALAAETLEGLRASEPAVALAGPRGGGGGVQTGDLLALLAGELKVTRQQLGDDRQSGPCGLQGAAVS